MTVYNDLYIRDNFGDTGVIPSTGNPYQSPDIIPYQNGTLDWNTANSTYNGPDIGKAIINNGVNNIYVRAKNLNTVPGAGTTNLYYANASLFLLPKTWTPITSAGGVKALPLADGSGGTSIAAGGIALSNPSFLLTGLPPGPHYCLIAVIQTTAHPITIPASFSTNSAFSDWVQNNPAVGWRNISYAPNSQVQVSRTLEFGNINPKQEYFYFRISGKGFVPNTPVTCQCTDSRCPITQNLTLPAPDAEGNQVTGFQTLVPANFWGDLVITLTSPSGPFPSGAVLTPSYYQIPDMANAMDRKVARRFITESGGNADAEFKSSMLIKLGQYTLKLTDQLNRAV